jgi:hypothetical protein
MSKIHLEFSFDIFPAVSNCFSLLEDMLFASRERLPLVFSMLPYIETYPLAFLEMKEKRSLDTGIFLISTDISPVL